MNSDEEYLNDLLKAVTQEDEASGEPVVEADSEINDGLADMSNDLDEADLINMMNSMDFGEAEEAETQSGQPETDDGFAIEDFGVLEPEEGELPSEDEESINEAVLDENANEEDALEQEDAAADDFTDFAIEDFGVMEPDAELMEEETGETEDIAEENTEAEDTAEENTAADDFADFAIDDFGEEEMPMSADEVDDMFAAADAVVNGGAEENPIVSTGSMEDDMLAMLESMEAEDEAAQAASDAAAPDTSADEKKSKKKKGLFSKRGEQKKAEDDLSLTDGEEGENAGDVPKKQGFFAKVVSFLTETDEEENADAEPGMNPSDENKSILNELEEEDKKKKKKKVKGKKGKKGDEEAEDAENAEDGEETADKKEKKKKKKKKEKEPSAAAADLEPKEEPKPGKRISKKNVAVIAGLCLTMTVVIVVLCNIVPGFFDKRTAREAFYHSDYEKSYDLLYGKKLDESDTIIYNKCRILMEMNRKLDAYHNYTGIGKGVQALDALMAGIEKYPDILLEAEEYHVTQEVDAIYETMLNILNDKYAITEDMAKAIIAYDDLTYTRKLESIVNGTPFVNPNAEMRSSARDLLPEEQAMIEEQGSLEEPEAVKEQVQISEQEVIREEELPVNNASDTSDSQSDTDAASTVSPQDEIETELPGNEAAGTPEQESAPVQPGNSSYDNTDIPSGNGSQGEMIQGIKQPISFEIHGQ